MVAPDTVASVPATWLGRTEARFRPFGLARFLGPPAEPDVRVPPHPALHKLTSSDYTLVPVAHGVTSVI